ncbi:hypothetical protein BDR07DRAFT_1461916 [Suillus spraguei]|nr:hypothetical protein BDR07DRAFT_1461916 [Suillus spraguei]
MMRHPVRSWKNFKLLDVQEKKNKYLSISEAAVALIGSRRIRHIRSSTSTYLITVMTAAINDKKFRSNAFAFIDALTEPSSRPGKLSPKINLGQVFQNHLAFRFLDVDFNCSSDSGRRRKFTRQDQKGKLKKMFDRLFADLRGLARILDWFRPHAIAYVSDTVSNEMDIVKEALHGTLDSVTP